MDNILEKYTPSELLTLFLDGELSPEQDSVVEAMIEASPEMQAEMDELLMIREAVEEDKKELVPSEDSQKAIFLALGIGAASAPVAANLVGGSSGLMTKFLIPAAGIISAGVIATFLYFTQGNDSKQPEIQKRDIPTVVSIEENNADKKYEEYNADNNSVNNSEINSNSSVKNNFIANSNADKKNVNISSTFVANKPKDKDANNLFNQNNAQQQKQMLVDSKNDDFSLNTGDEVVTFQLRMLDYSNPELNNNPNHNLYDNRVFDLNSVQNGGFQKVKSNELGFALMLGGIANLGANQIDAGLNAYNVGIYGVANINLLGTKFDVFYGLRGGTEMFRVGTNIENPVFGDENVMWGGFSTRLVSSELQLFNLIAPFTQLDIGASEYGRIDRLSLGLQFVSGVNILGGNSTISAGYEFSRLNQTNINNTFLNEGIIVNFILSY